jgi:predicted amidohydrolase YtcJ
MSTLRNRRAFLESAGFSAAMLTGSSWISYARAAEDKIAPDLIVINAKVTTMDDAKPRAEAFAILGDRFMAVGNTTEIKSLAGPKTRVYDAKGMMVVPGFIDTHNHGGGEGVLFGVNAGNPFTVEYVTIASVVEKLKARAAKTPPGTWIQAKFFDDTKVKDNRPITIADLDKASTQHPIRVDLRGGHAAFFNSKAFELAGVTKNTPNPFGGTFEKDARGELSGRATDRATRVMMKNGKVESFSPAEKDRRLQAGFEFITKKFAEFGVTSVCYDANLVEGMGDDVLTQIQTARAKGVLMTRINYETSGNLIEAQIKSGIKTGFGDEWLRFGGTSEHSVDGALSSRTMSMTRPYIGVSPPYYGNLTQSPEEFNPWVERMHRSGIRINTHCNGEPAIAMVLNAFERALKLYPVADARPKFTHCSLPNAEQIRRIKAMNGVPALFSTYTYYNSDKFKYYGADLAEHMIPYKDLMAAGVRASTGSDFYPGPFDPRMAIQGMVTRKGFNGQTWGATQRVTVDEAIRASTYNGAYNTREEAIKGSIAPGKLADYVVLAEDLHAIDPDKIKDVKIVQTVVGGIARYQA